MITQAMTAHTVCIPVWLLAVAAIGGLSALAVWYADRLVEWVLELITTEVTPQQWDQLMRHSPDPEPIARARTFGAQREISPTTRQARAAQADRRQRYKVVAVRVATVMVSLAMWAALYWLVL